MSHEQEIRVQEVDYAGAECPCALLKVPSIPARGPEV